MRKVAFLSVVTPARMTMLRSLVPDGYELQGLEGTATEQQRALVAEADYLITGGAHAVTAELLAAAPRLRLIHKWGVGVDEIDLAAARSRGIQVARTTGGNAVPVAEFTVGLMLSLARCIPRSMAGLREGRWLKGELSPQTFMLFNRTVGLVGMGAIGKRVAERLRGFECRVVYHSRTRLEPAEEARLGLHWRELPALLEQSDVVSLHCPLTAETRGLIGEREFAGMQRHAVLINVARGEVVQEAALMKALRSGRIAGAALDVFDIEPPPADHPLLHMDNVVVTPHLAGAAGDNAPRELARMFANIGRVERGEPIPELDRVV